MHRTIIAVVVLLAAVLSAQAATTGTTHHTRKFAAAQSSHGVVTYNRDSKDPNVGWHWEGGMRTCHDDCDNPEIPGSGYTCRNVQAFGMPMRECTTTN
jgi:hypothetical protein